MVFYCHAKQGAIAILSRVKRSKGPEIYSAPKARINLAKFLKINYKFIKFIINFDVTVRR